MKLRHLLALSAIAAMMALATGTASAQTITYRAGPFHVGGFETKLPKLQVRAPHMDGYITRMNATLHYANGRRVSIRKVMLHHIVFLNDGSPNNEPGGSCKGRKGEPFYGTGEEREQLLLPAGYGYRVREHDRWRMQTMLMSHSFAARNVYVQYTFTLTKRRMTPVRPFWIRANGCKTTQPSYSVQELSSGLDHRTFRWTIPMNGRIVAAGGHLHGGAERMSLTQPACHNRKLLDTDPLFGPRGDLVYRIRPILHEPGPVGTRFFQSKTGIPVRKGEKIDLQADYDATVPRLASCRSCTCTSRRARRPRASAARRCHAMRARSCCAATATSPTRRTSRCRSTPSATMARSIRSRRCRASPRCSTVPPRSP